MQKSKLPIIIDYTKYVKILRPITNIFDDFCKIAIDFRTIFISITSLKGKWFICEKANICLPQFVKLFYTYERNRVPDTCLKHFLIHIN